MGVVHTISSTLVSVSIILAMVTQVSTLAGELMDLHFMCLVCFYHLIYNRGYWNIKNTHACIINLKGIKQKNLLLYITSREFQILSIFYSLKSLQNHNRSNLITFMKVGLGGKNGINSKGWKMKTLSQHLKDEGHSKVSFWRKESF